MHTTRRTAVRLLSGVVTALALFPAVAHGAGSCTQASTGVAAQASQCAQQVSLQSSTTTQAAAAAAQVEQDLASANLPVDAAPAGWPAAGAERAASNDAASSAGNEAQTSQGNDQQSQGSHSSGCVPECGGDGQAQSSLEDSTAVQRAESQAWAEQNATVSAQASNAATSSAENRANAEQSSDESQQIESATCSLRCGADSQAQASVQRSTTTQAAQAAAQAQQDLTGARLAPELAPSGSLTAGSGAGAQDGASNSAHSSAGNEAQTSQSNTQSQHAGASDCTSGCGGSSQTQLSFEESITTQSAQSQARAEQNGTGASGDASNSTASGAEIIAATKQMSAESQQGESFSCSLDCHGVGQAQVSVQRSTTTQAAQAEALAGEAAGGAEPRAAPTSPGAQSSTATQLIWQVQLSECVMHCSGISESQTAEQRNEAVQAGGGAPQFAGADGTQVAQTGARGEQSIAQIEFGCVSDCFGTTTATPAPELASYAQALQAVMRAIRADISEVAAAAEQSVVEQTSYQSQRDPRGASAQSQSASQLSTSVQRSGAASSSTAGVQPALEGAPAPTAQADSHSVQAIWQLQIGCVMFCEETELVQRAGQSSSSAQNTVASQAATGAEASSANGTTELIWQVQIGCIYWCLNATEQQALGGQGTPGAGEAQGTPAPAPAQWPAEAREASGGLALPQDVQDELAGAKALVQEALGPEGAALLAALQQARSAPAQPSSGPGAAGRSPATSPFDSAPSPSPAPSLPGRSGAPSRPRSSAPRLWRASARRGSTARAVGGPAGHRVSAQPARGGLRAGAGGASAELAAVARLRRATTSGLADTALRSAAQTGLDGGTGDQLRSGRLSLATLLSAFALCAMCVFGIALVAARRDPRAGKPGLGG